MRFSPEYRIAVFALLPLFLMMALWGGAPNSAQANPRYASIVIDAETGTVLHERYADRTRHPASLVKMMTLMMAFDAIQTGRLRLSDRVVISRHAASMIPSKLGLSVGSSIRVEDAIYALITKSANDVAVALAEKIGGTERNFAAMMTRKARKIGMRRTRFRNASGLHDSRQVTTARDIAHLARYMIRAYPAYYHYFSTENFTYRGKTYRNHNRLMKTYVGMDGLKTGYINASGFNLAASAKRGDHRLIGIVFGGKTSKSRNNHMKMLLDRSFAKADRILLAHTAPVPPRKPAQAMVMAAFGDMASSASEEAPKWAALNPALQSRAFSKMIGQGDSDPAVSRRLETGLMASSMVRRHGMKQAVQPQNATVLKMASYQPQSGRMHHAASKNPSASAQSRSWAIQVGTFSSRVRTDKAIETARRYLPRELATQGAASIAPIRTSKGWMFRARLTGYTKTSAMAACRYLKDCLPVASGIR